MQMNYAEWVCPQCKTKNRETCNSWMYDSPIRQCKARLSDPQYVEKLRKYGYKV